MTTIEIISTVLGIIAVYLQTKEKLIAWPFAIMSVLLAAYVFYFAKLYSDFGLHIVFFILNIFGWVTWKKHADNQEIKPTKLLSSKHLVIFSFLSVIGTFLLGYFMFSRTDASLPFLDAFTTSTSLVAQYLLAKKYLQNWLFWIVVDVVAIPLYIYKGLYFFAFLFFVYLCLCIYGYISWLRNMKISH